MKTKLLIAAVMFLGLSAAAFAQATFTVGSIPVTAVIATGQTERTGDVTFTQNSGVSNAGTITINYGVPITVPFSTVTVTGTGGLAAASVNSASSNTGGQLVITVPAAGVAGNTIVVTGVRVAVAGNPITTLTASISSVGNAIVAGQTNVIVINNILAGLAGVNVSGNTVGVINGTSGTVTTQPTITIKEGFLNAWGAALPSGNTTSVNLRITLQSAPPTGVTVQFPATANTDATVPGQFTTADSTGATSGAAVSLTSSSTSLSVYYKITTDTDPAKQETLSIPLTITVGSTASLPLPASQLQFVATLSPIGNAFGSSNAVLTTPIPRFQQADTAAGTIYGIAGSTTALLVPFAQKQLGYDTGFAIANTTEDPTAVQMGGAITKAVAQTGPIVFYFYPQVAADKTTSPANWSYTTGATSPGTGLDASGYLISGSTYTVLLSELMTAAGQTGTFSGYAIIVTGFTNAHAMFTVSNFTTYSQGGLALVINGARNGAFESLNN